MFLLVHWFLTWPSNIFCWDISCCHSVLCIGAPLVFAGAGWHGDLTTLSSLQHTFVNCSVLSLSVSGTVLFPQHVLVFEVTLFTQAMCVFSLLSLKCKTAWGQGLCFPSLSSCPHCRDRPWHKSSDQYKIIDYVSEWMRVILPDVMSIVVIINIRTHLFKDYLWFIIHYCA